MEASSRILVDRSSIRVDGRPIFSFGPRVLLTPQESFPQALREIAEAGFTVVGSPPCSPGTLPLLDAFFDAAEAVGLLVILIADPRLPEHGRYLAERFRQRASLHSYMLPSRPADRESLAAFARERDAIRAVDLFHPIWMPLTSRHHSAEWLRNQDVYCPMNSEADSQAHRMLNQRPALAMRKLHAVARQLPSKPLFCGDLRVIVSDEERMLGLYSEDIHIARQSPRSLDWFPYLANFGNPPRRDLLGPDPEMLRLQVYDLLGAGTRGILLDFHEALGGPSPFTGRDRFLEASILAAEIDIFRDFFAEGRIETAVPIETGHPRLKAVVLRHGLEFLIVLRMEGYEEDYFIDEASLDRTEITVRLEGTITARAWRMDFPGARPLEIVRDSSGAMRFHAGALELTGLILLTPGTQRIDELANAVRDALPRVARMAVEELDIRIAKVGLIEGELQSMGSGVDNSQRLKAMQRTADEAHSFLAAEVYADAWTMARRGLNIARQIVKFQMAKALSLPVYERGAAKTQLRSRYYTLPRFYREVALDTASVFSDLT